MRLILLSVVSLSLALATQVRAQAPFRAPAWLPSDYRNVIHVDFTALRDTGVWDELDTGMFRVALKQLEREAGLQLRQLDRLTMVMDPPPEQAEAGGRASSPRQVLILEGNAPLGMPDSVLGSTQYLEEAIGDYMVHRRERFGDSVVFRPRPEVRIEGATELLLPMLMGTPKAGLPSADVLSLLSGDRRGELVYFVVNIGDPQMEQRALQQLFPETEWPEGDSPQYLMFRMRAVGDEDDPRIEAEAVLRHVAGGEGVAVTEKVIDDLLAKAASNPQMLILRPLLAKVERSTDRGDVIVKLDLGRAREAATTLTMILVPMFTARVTEVQVIEVAPLEEPAVEPAPTKKKNGKL